MLNRDKYLRERAYRERSKSGDRYPRRDYRPEYRNRYDSRDYRYSYDFENEYMGYEQPREFYRDNAYDMRYDYRRDYSSDDYDMNYHKDLKKWTEKLKKKDRFGLDKNQVINAAKEMGVNFKDYDEDEFYAIYLMHITDYPKVANEPRLYMGMAKSWLEDDDISIEPSEKVCKYLYEIVMDED